MTDAIQDRRFQLSLRAVLALIAGLALVLGLGRAVWVAVDGAREAARRSQCSGHFCGIVLALQNYHDRHGCFPPAMVRDSRGKPMHSWRVLLLPYLDAQNVYDAYDFREPWDGPNNRRLAGQMPQLYRCPSGHSGTSPYTDYVAVLGKHTAFPPNGSVKLADFRDGDDSILLVEVADSDFHWMEPRDLDFESMSFQLNDPAGHAISSPHRGGALVSTLGSCSGRFLPNRARPDDVRALLTIDGAEGVSFERTLRPD